ncbi:signal transduction histidine kinase [Inquilinus ginsengisoli]|uniref:histidine kinase n=1 Tax=Inquilinus ginsengisoli TaxID=363840 RepID=A0ABU1JVI8_9PROT|nr:HAMP domain-containing sensor histidine kinase [Inquilinus ginsengisoli]MDR6292645.1 signal transduction histidine kinase [Inquilinus ginsengisoli]
MTARPQRSLRRRLVVRLVAFQAVVLLAVTLTLKAFGFLVDMTSTDATIERLRPAVVRDAAGGLALDQTPQLDSLRVDAPDLWFVIRDREGHRLSEGSVPMEFAALGDALDRIGQARLGWNIGDPPGPTGRLRWVDSPAGEVQILTGSESPLPLSMIGLSVALLLLNAILPIMAVMALATLVATPLVVRGALAGLDRAAAQAKRIDIDQRGVRLPVDDMPTEVAPLVKAVNDALGRLDEGYERHRRFLADAAHELRTPIAILNIRIASLPPGRDKTRLLEDAARLAVLTEQLLDLQRLDRQGQMAPVDLVVLARRVVSDIAPLAFAAGYQMAFEAGAAEAADARPVLVSGDRTSLERALTNLVQNAIDHGGRRGLITVRVAAPGIVEVADEGAGIPAEQHERVFEPFYRLHPQGQGAGLGLNLVRETMRLHGGRVVVSDGASGGACLRMIFPAPDAAP